MMLAAYAVRPRPGFGVGSGSVTLRYPPAGIIATKFGMLTDVTNSPSGFRGMRVPNKLNPGLVPSATATALNMRGCDRAVERSTTPPTSGSATIRTG